MTDLRNVQMLTRYRMWADERTFDAVAALPPGEAAKMRPTHFRTMIGTLNHIHLVDLVWQAHLEGRSHGFESRELMLHESLPELRAAQQAINQWYIDWSDVQSAGSLDELVRFRFIDGDSGAMTRGEILLHVVNHATYHRGWIAEMFFHLPARNPTTDLPVYLSDLHLRHTGPLIARAMHDVLNGRVGACHCQE